MIATSTVLIEPMMDIAAVPARYGSRLGVCLCAERRPTPGVCSRPNEAIVVCQSSYIGFQVIESSLASALLGEVAGRQVAGLCCPTIGEPNEVLVVGFPDARKQRRQRRMPVGSRIGLQQPPHHLQLLLGLRAVLPALLRQK